MKRALTTTAALAALALAAACSGDPAAENNQATMAGNDQSAVDMNAMAADPNNPYAQAEMQMGQRMMAAVGDNAADTWVRKMIEHHKGAIAMTEILAQQGGNPQVLEKARMTAQDQRRELQELERLLQGGVSGNPPANPYAETEQRSHQQMMAASGASPSETWLVKMIEHHRGGIAMSEIVIAQGGNPEVAAMARKSAEAQRRDIEALERLLGADTPAASAGGSTAGETEPAVPAAQPKAAPVPAARSSPRPATPRSEPKSEPAGEPPATATPAQTCTPEHRAAGHC